MLGKNKNISFLRVLILGTSLSLILIRDGKGLQLEMYRVKPGDQLGNLLYERGFSPLWGPKGLVEKFKRFNHLKSRHLEVGERIVIPTQNIKIKKLRRPNRKIASVNSENIKPIAKNDKQTVFIRTSNFQVNTKISYSKVKLVDPEDNTSLDLFSKANTGLDISWNQNWSKNIQSSLFVDLTQYNFQAPSNRTINHAKKSLVSTGIKLKKNLSEELKTNLTLRFGEELFISAQGGESITIEKATTPSGTLGIEKRLLDLKPFQLNIFANTRYLLGTKVSNYKSDNSLGYGGGLNIRQREKSKTLFGEIKYDTIKKDTNNLNQTHNNLIITMGLTWDF